MTLESPDACVRLLERRYRRLLRWFPAGHREVHGEEMLGVLLAGSAPGQVRPGFAEAVNLATAGLRVRLRPGGALSDPDGWRDALATFSVSAPLLLLAGTCLSFLTEYAVTSYSPGQGSFLNVVLIGDVLVLPLALAGLRRTAAVAAGVQLLVLAGVLAASPLIALNEGTIAVETTGYAMVSLTQLAALVALTRSGRARRPLSRGLLASLGAAALPASLVLPGSVLPRLSQLRGVAVPSWVAPVAVMALAALALVAAVAWLSSPGGKRLVVLFAVIGYPLLLTWAARLGRDHPWQLSLQAGMGAAVSMLLLGGGVATLVWWSGRRDRARGGSPGAVS
jgi:hypothetical protein